MEQKSLKEQANDVMNVAVNTAKANIQSEFKFIDDRLAKLELHFQQALLQMLGAAIQVRELEGKNAIAEFQYKIAKKREAEQAEAQRKLEAEQAEIEEANKPRLAPVTQ